MRQARLKLLQLVKACQELLKFGQGAGQREAYLAVCDLLIAFGRHLQQVGQLGPLIYTADNSLQEALQVGNCVAVVALIQRSMGGASFPLLSTAVSGMALPLNRHIAVLVLGICAGSCDAKL